MHGTYVIWQLIGTLLPDDTTVPSRLWIHHIPKPSSHLLVQWHDDFGHNNHDRRKDRVASEHQCMRIRVTHDWNGVAFRQGIYCRYVVRAISIAMPVQLMQLFPFLPFKQFSVCRSWNGLWLPLLQDEPTVAVT
jgi:hypothetical protein